MATDSSDPTSSITDSITNFTADAAIQLVQAFHQQLDLDTLLELFLRQANALANSTGLIFEAENAGLRRALGVTRKHQVRYNLQWPEIQLGSLTLFFDTRAPEHALSTAEDLIALVAGALKNAVTHSQARAAQPATTLADSERSVHQALAAVPKSDSLILVALDGFAELQNNSGPAWAQAVLDSVQSVLNDALREADGVFQIREGLLAVLLPGTHNEAAEQVAQKICVHIASLHLASDRIGEQLTACMGIATSKPGDSAKDVLARAEQTLHLAQMNGPNAISRGRLRSIS